MHMCMQEASVFMCYAMEKRKLRISLKLEMFHETGALDRLMINT